MLKSERLTIKVTATQKVVVEEIARAEGESVAAVVRQLIREEAGRRGLSQSTERGRCRE